jgi:hypothetical protein
MDKKRVVVVTGSRILILLTQKFGEMYIIYEIPFILHATEGNVGIYNTKNALNYNSSQN